MSNSKEIKSREIMISKNGKPMFAVRIDSENSGSDASYVYIENGDIRFSSSWLGSVLPFTLGDKSHELAKEIFTVGLQATVKIKVMELMQLQSILTDINLQECLGSVLIDNTKLLLEVKESVSQNQEAISNVINMSKDTIRETVGEAIIDTIQPLALKKRR